MHSSGVFIFSIWPNSSPSGKRGREGRRQEGELNTITTAQSLCVGRGMRLLGKVMQMQVWLY